MITDQSRKFFVVFFIASLIVFGLLMQLFWISVGLAAVITLICSPLNKRLLKAVKYRYLAAFLATLIVFLVLVVPTTAMMTILVTQVFKFIQNVSVLLQDGTLAQQIDDIGRQLTDFINRFVDVDPDTINLRASLIEFSKSVGHNLYQYSPQVLTSTMHVLLNTVLCMFFTFIFFADGGTLYTTIVNVLPLTVAHEEQISSQVRQMVTATLSGLIATAVVNGFLIGLAFWVCGLPKPLLWGIVAIGFSFVPVIGAPIIWGGGVVVLLIHGQLHFAIGLMLYGLIVIAQVDNVVKPIVMRNSVDIHPALLLICLLGGMNLFGPSGLVFGPVMLSLIVATFRIYQQDFAPSRE